LLAVGNLVPISVQPKLPKHRFWKQMGQLPPPGIIDPASKLGRVVSAQELRDFGLKDPFSDALILEQGTGIVAQLLVNGIDADDTGVGMQQSIELLPFARARGIEYLRLPRARVALPERS
jgi:hypothetical protein